MVKIKNKVTLKPKEFVKYLLDLEETELTLHIETEDRYNNLIKPKLKVENYITYNEEKEAFTIEAKEEITEETVIPRLLEVRNAIPSKEGGWEDLKILKSYIYGNHTIAEVKNEYTVAFYMLNDDMTMTLIWKDGKLVD